MNVNNHIKVEGNSTLVRNVETTAIVNTDTSAYSRYMKTILKKKKESESLEHAIDDIDSLKSDMQEIKILLQKLMDRN
jgi:hypothetical protein